MLNLPMFFFITFMIMFKIHIITYKASFIWLLKTLSLPPVFILLFPDFSQFLKLDHLPSFGDINLAPVV